MLGRELRDEPRRALREERTVCRLIFRIHVGLNDRFHHHESGNGAREHATACGCRGFAPAAEKTGPCQIRQLEPGCAQAHARRRVLSLHGGVHFLDRDRALHAVVFVGEDVRILRRVRRETCRAKLGDHAGFISLDRRGNLFPFLIIEIRPRALQREQRPCAAGGNFITRFHTGRRPAHPLFQNVRPGQSSDQAGARARTENGADRTPVILDDVLFGDEAETQINDAVHAVEKLAVRTVEFFGITAHLAKQQRIGGRAVHGDFLTADDDLHADGIPVDAAVFERGHHPALHVVAHECFGGRQRLDQRDGRFEARDAARIAEAKDNLPDTLQLFRTRGLGAVRRHCGIEGFVEIQRKYLVEPVVDRRGHVVFRKNALERGNGANRFGQCVDVIRDAHRAFFGHGLQTFRRKRRIGRRDHGFQTIEMELLRTGRAGATLENFLRLAMHRIGRRGFVRQADVRIEVDAGAELLLHGRNFRGGYLVRFEQLRKRHHAPHRVAANRAELCLRGLDVFHVLPATGHFGLDLLDLGITRLQQLDVRQLGQKTLRSTGNVLARGIPLQRFNELIFDAVHVPLEPLLRGEKNRLTLVVVVFE